MCAQWNKYVNLAVDSVLCMCLPLCLTSGPFAVSSKGNSLELLAAGGTKVRNTSLSGHSRSQPHNETMLALPVQGHISQ